MIILMILLPIVWAQAPESIELSFEPLTPIEGSAKWDWWQARTAYVPGETPLWLTTMSETGQQGAHDFHDVYQSLSRDAGQTWSEPQVVPSLKRITTEERFEVSPGDLWPKWHAKNGKILATGKTFNFEKGVKERRERERVSYVVFDPQSLEWGPLQFLEMPEQDASGSPIIAANAGCNQWVALPDGDVLLPIR